VALFEAAGDSRYDPRALATVEDFLELDLRVGTIVSARSLRGARKPAFALSVDFGALGVKSSSAQITDLYEAEDLVGLQVVAVVNFPSRRVAGLDSEVLVLAVDDGKGESVLLMPERPVPDGGRVS
jgi:tRNA-binding protein